MKLINLLDKTVRLTDTNIIYPTKGTIDTSKDYSNHEIFESSFDRKSVKKKKLTSVVEICMFHMVNESIPDTAKDDVMYIVDMFTFIVNASLRTDLIVPTNTGLFTDEDEIETKGFMVHPLMYAKIDKLLLNDELVEMPKVKKISTDLLI